MRIIWTAGVAHALIGSTLLFLCLHPLRDALAAPELDLMKTGSAWQALNGLALMIASVATRSRIAGGLIAIGVALSSATIAYIAFTADRPAWIVAVPIGGAISIIGWTGLLIATPRSPRP